MPPKEILPSRMPFGTELEPAKQVFNPYCHAQETVAESPERFGLSALGRSAMMAGLSGKARSRDQFYERFVAATSHAKQLVREHDGLAKHENAGLMEEETKSSGMDGGYVPKSQDCTRREWDELMKAIEEEKSGRTFGPREEVSTSEVPPQQNDQRMPA